MCEIDNVVWAAGPLAEAAHQKSNGCIIHFINMNKNISCGRTDERTDRAKTVSRETSLFINSLLNIKSIVKMSFFNCAFI